MASMIKIFVTGIGVLCLATGCSSGDGNSQTSASPTISLQPVAQTVEPGQPATFAVSANGSMPISYQWYWNGLVVDGATAASYTTPQTVPSDNLSTLTVSISNSFGKISSSPAVLSVQGGPRPPKFGDLRFKDVDSFPIPLQASQVSNILGGSSVAFEHMIGTPLELSGLGPNVTNDMAWSFAIFNLPAGAPDRSTFYMSDTLANIETDFLGLENSSSLIASLDIQPGPNVFAWEGILSREMAGYSPEMRTVSASDLQSVASQEGTSSRVITAVSSLGDQVTYISYGWQGDTATVYEASVALATVDTLASVATNLSEQGFIITALGGNTTNGFTFVGTRVKGDPTPRPIFIWTSTSNQSNVRGYAYVGHVFTQDPTNPTSGKEVWILQQ